VPDELARWAARRAPELLARAESEAVEELKRILLEAAMGARPERPETPRPARQEAAPAEVRRTEPGIQGDALWAYCVTRSGEPPAVAGVHGAPVERVEEKGLGAFVSRVPLDEFGEEPLRRNLNDLDWLERVARSHEAVLERALDHGTIVPLRICTIFADEQGVARMLAEQATPLQTALDALSGRQEWGVKLLVDRASLDRVAAERTPPEEGLEGQGAGGAYMLRRRHERHVREAADRLAEGLADDVHARLLDWASDAVVNPPQNRELSGHEGDMLLNAAYLVETAKVDRLRELVDELGEQHRGLGARLELTGPWPPYNFVPRTETALA
jgi:Gas vesicle synthesis protein GvpL/GvpF